MLNELLGVKEAIGNDGAESGFVMERKARAS
jgi:hypothetical protein